MILGGLNNISWGTSDESWGYLVYALDDRASDLKPLEGVYFEQTFNQLSESGQSLRMDTFFVNALDVDGDSVDEVQANQYIFDDHVNAAAWTELYRIPESDLIGEEGKGFAYILDGMNPERILIAAEAVGLGMVAIHRAARYAQERIVFNRPIGQNQAIQHPLAEAIAANSPLAVEGSKAVLRAGEDMTTAQALDHVALWNAAFLQSNDLGEALTAFAEKRSPRFTGT